MGMGMGMERGGRMTGSEGSVACSGLCLWAALVSTAPPRSLPNLISVHPTWTSREGPPASLR